MAATFVGIAVTAVLGALALAREQSVLRRLERISTVLKETPDHAAGRPHLEWLRDDLARRVNLQYRAPRDRWTLVAGWTVAFAGLLLLLGAYVLLVVLAALSIPQQDPSETTVEDAQRMLWVVMAVGLVVFAAGTAMRFWRDRQRRKWAEQASPDDSKAPLI